jgi:hypothetical protein
MPVSRLNFEHQKRQQRISVLEMKQISLQRQYEAIEEMWAEETSRLQTSRDWHNYNPPSTSRVESDMSEVSLEISSLNEEIAAIENTLGTKWA